MNRIARARKRIAVNTVATTTPANHTAITSTRAALIASVVEQMCARGKLARGGSEIIVNKHDE
jgi:predicted RNA polymerase sigma factor